VLLLLALGAGGVGALLGNRGLSRATPLHGRALLAAWVLLTAVSLALLAPYAAAPAALLAGVLVATAALSGGLLSDLREREVDVLPLFGGALAIALGSWLAGSSDGLLGGLVGLGFATGIYAFGRLYARARGLGLDPETGEQLDPLGAGDIALLALLGAWAAPVAGILAAVPVLVFAFLLHVIVTLSLLALKTLLGKRASIGDPVELAPFLVTATLVIAYV
jgi:hypothetical protein